MRPARIVMIQNSIQMLMIPWFHIFHQLQNRRACNLKKKSCNFLTLFTLIVEKKIPTKQCKIFEYLQTYTLTKSIKTFSE